MLNTSAREVIYVVRMKESYRSYCLHIPRGKKRNLARGPYPPHTTTLGKLWRQLFRSPPLVKCTDEYQAKRTDGPTVLGDNGSQLELTEDVWRPPSCPAGGAREVGSSEARVGFVLFGACCWGRRLCCDTHCRLQDSLVVSIVVAMTVRLETHAEIKQKGTTQRCRYSPRPYTQTCTLHSALATLPAQQVEVYYQPRQSATTVSTTATLQHRTV